MPSPARPQYWRRLGHIYNAQAGTGWMATHAAYPTPLVLDDGGVRVFFSPRDAAGRSSIATLDLRLDGPHWSIAAMPGAPLLTPGARGAFDDSGVSVSCVVPDADRILVYYLGWSLAVTVPFRNFVVLAVGARGGGPLRRVAEVPILERSAIDPYSLGYPWVVRTADRWCMWYGSHLAWGREGPEMRHVIKEASSRDGLAWDRTGRIAIDLAGGDEFAVSRPCVVRDGDAWRMWFARRDPDYALAYAESSDGIHWVRADRQVVLTGPVGAWEADSVEYVTVFDRGRHRYMLYNGNGYGRTGFGLAMLEC
jgi:hypothetical protein